MWHLTRLINYPDNTEVETSQNYEEQHQLERDIIRLLNRLNGNKISSIVLTILHKK